MRRAALVVTAALALPASAAAHASLVGGTPEPGSVTAAAPRAVSLTFDEAVDAKLATIRVEDGHGRRWDVGGVREGGGGHTVRVALRAGAPHGTYAVLYRVVSDDGHTFPGGFGFAVGREVAPPPAQLDVGGGAVGAGGGLGTASAVARAARDGGLAVAVGALLFAVLVWPAVLAEAAGADERWRRTAAAVARALRRLIGGAALLGAAASASLMLLAAAPSDVSPATLGAVLDTRFGRFTAAAGVLLGAVGAMATAARGRRRAGAPVEAPSLRVAQLGATGLAVAPPPGRAVVAAGALSLALALLVVVAGHATTRARPVLLTASGTVHVLAASVWIGGVAALLVVLREPALARAALRRFATVALLAVAALALTGLVQALVEVGSLHALADAAFGRAVVVKVGLLLVVLGIAAGHRLDDPRATTRTLRAEALGLVALLVATGVLAGSAPPAGAPPGPPAVALAFQQASLRGTADREGITFTLARPGNGLAFADFERLGITASGPDGRRATATLRARPGGRYRAPLRLTPGRWRLAVRLRVDTYNSYTRTTEVTLR